MRTVSRFEANLLQILHCVLGRAPLSQTLPLVVRSMPQPPCLSRDCVELVQQALANGIVSMLARAGGWQQERFLRDATDEGRIAEGRLWDRTRPRDLGLEFSVNSVDFLMWLTATSAGKSRWSAHKLREPTTGDQLLVFLTFKTFRNSELGGSWSKQKLFQTNGLCALTFVDDFVDHEVRVEADFAPWLTDAGVGLLESLQAELARRWVEMERAKSQIVTPQRMKTFGELQERVLAAYLDAIERANRRDLARFLLIAAERIMADSPRADHWIGSVNVIGLRASDRMSTYEDAFAFLRQLDRLRQWDESFQGVGYFDENYAASQLWKADWERYRMSGHCEAATDIIRQAEPMGT